MILLILCVLYLAFTGLTLFMFVRLQRAFKLFRMEKLITEARFLNDLPSVSVCIPARNETHAMTQCLESVIASRYPKMEVLVLDDESVDNTSYLIKSFAHAGVRFVAGTPLPDGWLGKNHALRTLLHEASGSYVLYMDVDTQIKPDTIGQLVAYADQTSAKMISVAPMRLDGWRSSVIFSTLRYFWELVFHTDSRPAAASAAWMIHRHTLRDELDGFEPLREKVQPEASLASRLAADGVYRFLISTDLLGVHYEKKWRSQCETARRLLYPKFAALPGGVISGILFFIILLSPVVVLLLLLLEGLRVLALVFVLQMALYHVLYAVFVRRMWRNGWWLGLIVWPYVLVQEAVLFMLSVIGYKTGTITWKGRPLRRSS